MYVPAPNRVVGPIKECLYVPELEFKWHTARLFILGTHFVRCTIAKRPKENTRDMHVNLKKEDRNVLSWVHPSSLNHPLITRLYLIIADIFLYLLTYGECHICKNL